MSSVAFDDMFAIRRGKERFFCFVQARQELFSNVNNIIFSNALLQLAVEVVPCTGEEFFFFSTTSASSIFSLQFN